MGAGVLAAAAIILCAGPLMGAGSTDAPATYVWVAPLTAAAFLVALVAMFAQRERHGLARALFTAGATVLAAVGVLLLQEIRPGLLLAFYWAPAILALSAAVILAAARGSPGALSGQAPPPVRR